MFYIFFGKDELSRDEAIAQLLARVEDPATGDLNISRLDGRTLTFDQLRQACDAMPFLSDRRIVIVRDLLARFKQGNKEFHDQLVAYLPTMPPTTRLIFIETDVDKRLRLWKLAQDLSKENPPRAFVKEFALPSAKALPRWIAQRVQKKGGRIEPRAAHLLAEVIGEDTRLLDQELEKLTLYANGDPITVEMVRRMVPYTHAANIFALVDAIGRRQPRHALQALHHLFQENAAPTYLHYMMTRQIRLILQVKDLHAQGMDENAIRERLRQHPFVIKKLLAQSQNFTFEELETAFERLLECDIDIKTGQTDPLMAIELLVTRLAAR